MAYSGAHRRVRMAREHLTRHGIVAYWMGDSCLVGRPTRVTNISGTETANLLCRRTSVRATDTFDKQLWDVFYGKQVFAKYLALNQMLKAEDQKNASFAATEADRNQVMRDKFIWLHQNTWDDGTMKENAWKYRGGK